MDDAGTPPPPDVLSALGRHLEACYPHEGCGVLLRAGDGTWRARPLRNARPTRTTYAFEPREWLAVLQEAEARGAQVACVFHSHVDAGVEFSAEDRHQAAPEGEPLLPGVCYLVVSVCSGRATQAALFGWNGAAFGRLAPAWLKSLEKTGA